MVLGSKYIIKMVLSETTGVYFPAKFGEEKQKTTMRLKNSSWKKLYDYAFISFNIISYISSLIGHL